MRPAIGDTVTNYLGRPATIVDTDGNGLYKTTSSLWWTWDGKTLQEAEAPTEAPGSAGEGYTACVARLLPELAALPNWVAYKMVPSRKRPGKTDKRPINPHTGKLARADDSASWATFDQAAAFLARRPKLDGLGFQLGESPERKSGIVGVDLDNCIDPAGNLAPWAAEIVERLDSYTEVSPSGAGIRIFCRGELPADGRKKGDIEMYDSGRFLTVTGNVWGAPRPIREGTAELATVHAAVFGERAKAASNGSGPATTTLNNLDDANLLEMARNASNGAAFWRLWQGDTGDHGGDHSAADLALCNHLAFYTGNDEKRIDRLFRQSGLMRDKWDERHFSDGRTYGQATIEKAIASTGVVYSAGPGRPAAASKNGTGPRFAVGQLVNVVIGSVLQNSAPCLVMTVHEPVNGEYGYTLAWPGEEQPKTYSESCLEAAEDEPAKGSNTAQRANGSGPATNVLQLRPEAGGALYDEHFEPLVFLVADMLAKGQLAVFGGRPKSGKSWLMLQAAQAVDTGRAFLGRSTRPGRVLYIDLEGGRRRANQRLHLLRWRPTNAAFLFQIANFDGDGGPGPGLAQLDGLAADYDLVVIDTLVATLSGRANENDNVQMGAIVNELARIAHDTDTAIVLIHHTGKGQSDDPFNMLRGASAIRGGYDLGLLLERKQGEREALLHVESRDFESFSLTIQQADGGAGWEALGDGLKLTEIRAGRKAAQAMQDHGDPLTAEELAKLLGITRQAARKQLLNLERDGYAARVPEAREGSDKPVDVWSLT